MGGSQHQSDEGQREKAAGQTAGVERSPRGPDSGDELARRPGESAEEWQDRLRRLQHRPEQSRGYDEAVERPGIPGSHPIPPDQRPRREP